ncbi:MAG: phnA protein [Verrucomicrobiales bacterium]|nr:phnA protein [Verrucomicrobiales bacterium]|tara:strand:- start:12347 stop:12748 length:402 start_codon:yes stop_codon:yes gene_type:complete
MAKGREVHLARVAALQCFGKDLARRSKSKCELCERAGEALSIVEVPPIFCEPAYERCVMLCESCRLAVEDQKRFSPGEQWRFLAQSVWSELPAVQVLAGRLLKRIEASEAWAREALESVYMEEDVEIWVTEAE